jgi:starch synthase
MRVLHAAAECYPVVRTGGLGDVMASLPRAEAALGHDVRLLLPGYPSVLEAMGEAVEIASLGDILGGRSVLLRRGRLPGSTLPVYALDAPGLFDRTGNPYVGGDGLAWPDNGARFGLFSWAAAQLARGGLDPFWRAEILHAHDWHVGLAATYLRLEGDPRPAPGSVFTVHNLAFQGLFPPSLIAELGLPPTLFTPAGIEFWGEVSFMKAALIHADRVTTVSPGYAAEIATPAFGCGLDGVIRDRGADVSGILNGVDEATWDPAADPVLAQHYDAKRLDLRRANREALLAELGLTPSVGPVFGIVSRLTEQKGIDLVLGALPRLLACGGSLVVLGAGDQALEQALLEAAAGSPGRIAVVLRYDDALSHRIMAGIDALLVPSRFEPCGLTQLYALRYGAVPVVRRTGGLGDTVADATPSALANGTATGFVFDDASAESCAEAIERAARLFVDSPQWRRLQQSGMRQRFAWETAAAAYLALYRAIRPAA